MGLSNNLGKLSNMITSTGSAVGIGTTSPTALLQIAGAQAGVSGKNLTISYNGTYYAEYTEKSISAFNNPLTFGAGATGAEMMRISASGNVGIGNSNPQKKLDISGDAFAGIGIYDGTNTAVMQWHTSDGFRIVTATAKPIVFFTNDTEKMRITSTGQLATTFNTADNNAVFANINSNPYGPWIKFTTDPNNTTNYYLVCSAFVGGTEYNKLKITSNGNVYNVTGTYTSGVSDVRYKEQIVNANSQWNDIKSLRVVNFKFIKDVEQNGDNALRQIGFIAQEVEKVSPNLIDEMSDEKTGETWKTIKTSIIHTKSIKALQEAMARIEELESRLDKAGL